MWQCIQNSLRQTLECGEINIVTTNNVILATGDMHSDFVIAYCKWSIWKARNMVLFENAWYTEYELYDKIVTSVNSVLDLFNRLQTTENKMPLFLK